MPQFQKYKLGELGEVITGKTPASRFPQHFGNYIPFITPSDFGGYVKSAETASRYISEEGAEAHKNKILPENSVLVTCIGSDMGKVVVNKKPCLTNQQINSIIPNKEVVDYNFLYYSIINQYELLRSIASDGTTMPIINKIDFEEIEIEIPEDLSTQTFIASILSCLDDKIELNRRTNQTLEQIAQTLFKKYFVDDIDPENLPEGWRWGKLGDVTIRITKGTTPTTLKKQFVLSGINFLKVENLTETGTFDKSKLNFIDEETDKMLSRSRIQDKDILFSIAGTLGRMALVNESILPANTNQALAIIRPDLNISEPLYVFYWLKQSNVREEIFSKSVQGVQANLSLGVLSDIDIIIPTKDVLIQKFKNINPIYKKIEQNENEIALLAKIRDSLLPKLMSGEIEVNATEKELVS